MTVCKQTSGVRRNDVNICITNSGTSVIVDMNVKNDAGEDTYFDWTMELQRIIVPGSWMAAGTRTGYIRPSSPSSRTFTDVAIRETEIRAKVVLTDVDGNVYTAYSAQIIR